MIIDQQLRLQRHYNFPEVYESNPFEKSVIEDTFHATLQAEKREQKQPWLD